MGQPRSRLPTSSKPAPSPKPASSPKREPPKERNPEEELKRKRAAINRRYKVGCFLAFLGVAGSRDDNAGNKAVKQSEYLAKTRDYELWEAQVEYDKATGKSTAGSPPPLPYPDPPPQFTTPPSPRDWLGRP